jgi:rRNA maturation RNase YbeY
MPYLLAHGIIHLMGFDHENEEDWLLMTQKEDKVIRELALAFPDSITL